MTRNASYEITALRVSAGLPVSRRALAKNAGELARAFAEAVSPFTQWLRENSMVLAEMRHSRINQMIDAMDAVIREYESACDHLDGCDSNPAACPGCCMDAINSHIDQLAHIATTKTITTQKDHDRD